MEPLIDDYVVRIKLAKNPKKENNIKYSEKFKEVKPIIEEIDQLIPISNYYLLTGRFPREEELVSVIKDGGRCCIIPNAIDFNGRKMLVGIKGIGADCPFEFDKVDKLKKYYENIDKRNVSYRLFISPSEYQLGRPLGGQCKEYAEADLSFTNNLSKDFELHNAYFVPTVAISELDETSKNVLKKVAESYGEKCIPVDEIVQEYRLLPSNINLIQFRSNPKIFLTKFGIETEKEKRKFFENLEKSLYSLTIFPMNTVREEDNFLYYTDLLPPLQGFPNEILISLEGKVYWKDLENIQIHAKIYNFNKSISAFKKKEVLFPLVKRDIHSSVYEYLFFSFNEILRIIPRYDLETLIERFLSLVKSNSVKFSTYQIKFYKPLNDESDVYKIELYYSHPILGEDKITLKYVYYPSRSKGDFIYILE